MKVELENLTLNMSPLTEEVFVGIQKGNEWKHKKSVTNEFIGCALARWMGKKEVFTASNGKKYEISAKEIE